MTRQGVVLASDITSSMSFLYSNFIGRCLLKILVQPFVSKTAGYFLSSKLSTLFISSFIQKNHIDMSEYKEVEYKSFNDFFTREIKDGARRISTKNEDLVSPCDSKLSIYKINRECLLDVKGSLYTMEDILQNKDLAKQYEDGYALVFRLSVDDYHRYMAIDHLEEKAHYKIKGIFHTVNPLASYYYPIYKQNAREVTVYQSDHFGKITYIEVGAMMVGKIKNLPQKELNRGQIKGYFEFGGSTVVVLFQKNSIQIDEDLVKYNEQGYEVKIKMGEVIGKASI